MESMLGWKFSERFCSHSFPAAIQTRSDSCYAGFQSFEREAEELMSFTLQAQHPVATLGNKDKRSLPTNKRWANVGKMSCLDEPA